MAEHNFDDGLASEFSGLSVSGSSSGKGRGGHGYSGSQSMGHGRGQRFQGHMGRGRGRGGGARGGRGGRNEPPHYILFNGMEGDDSLIKFKEFDGLLNPRHDYKVIRKPHIILESYDDTDSELCKERYCKLFEESLQKIKTDYTEEEHGPLRVVVSFGAIYCFFRDVPQGMTLGEFDKFIISVHQNSLTGEAEPALKHSFYPADTKLGLDGNPDFTLSNERERYTITIKRKITDKYAQARLILDASLKPTKMIFKHFKWGTLDVTEIKGVDIRTKIQSRETKTKDEMEDDVKWGDLVDEKTIVLIKKGDDNMVIGKNYREEVNFVLHKLAKIYTLVGSKFPALQGAEVYLETTKEFSRPKANGEFGSVISKGCEITLRPEYDNLHKKSTEEKREFAQQLGDLAIWFKENSQV